MKTLARNWLALLFSLNLSACSVISAKPGLPVSHDLGPGGVLIADSVNVTLTAPVWLWDERIRYRLLYKDATVVRYYQRHRWEAPLPALLERRLKIAGASSLTLQIQLTQFEQQFSTADNARVLMALTVNAIAEDGFNSLGKRSFSFSQHTVSADAVGAIAGFIALTEEARNAIGIWLKTLAEAP
ncbi:MAG: hypothetical protein CVV13_01035 [Gammaproteobacteria bacterium HGW-Gammaproteobacteria-3]|jgi:hypothetical protein|nr:MAG: hypothetical protein CVV13_01035 [Gammaproteobacteria bacterium HGW-Gammaproteobacteria-3]